MSTFSNEVNEEETRIIEACSNLKDVMHLIPDIARAHYPEVAERLEQRIRKLAKDPKKSLGERLIGDFAAVMLLDQEILFVELEQSKRSARGGPIDLSSKGYLSYNNIHGILAYAKSVNHPNYTINRDADGLFRALLHEGFFDTPKPMITLLYSGTSAIEMCWSYAINERNRVRDENIVVVDSSMPAMELHQLLFDGTRIQSEVMQGEMDYEFLRKRVGLLPEHKHIIIKHNGVCCESLDDNYSELIHLQSATKFKNPAVFYTAPTTSSKTSACAYLSDDPNEMPFAYSTLTNLLRVAPADLKKFSGYVSARTINVFRSFTYEIGFKTNEDVTLRNERLGRSVSLPKGTHLILQRSNRYSPLTLETFANDYYKLRSLDDGVVAITT